MTGLSVGLGASSVGGMVIITGLSVGDGEGGDSMTGFDVG
eukprot:CAMPEP_0202018068 /NCGR_PEP_ID=MMETSP0905-20130828/38617_1 /ASSEMBLY_ACC=CAM_ASM_000554 /TAXON_ID=420261 /ORGANISM="Thalassiosira antarctica, Strain CCMP982" /LENGTH=39 /DNA_ID= /DNA_START= /DNA_END= /DNA_ORIENTATION=